MTLSSPQRTWSVWPCAVGVAVQQASAPGPLRPTDSTVWPCTAAAAAKAPKSDASAFSTAVRAARQQRFEQPELGAAVGVHVGVVVEVVLRQVGEAGGRQRQSVETALVEAVRRGLQRQVGDAAARQQGRQPGDFGGVGRGQPRRRQRLVASLQAERAQAGGL